MLQHSGVFTTWHNNQARSTRKSDDALHARENLAWTLLKGKLEDVTELSNDYCKDTHLLLQYVYWMSVGLTHQSSAVGHIINELP